MNSKPKTTIPYNVVSNFKDKLVAKSESMSYHNEYPSNCLYCDSRNLIIYSDSGMLVKG